MRRLIVSTFLTLDGVMQAPGGPGEDDSGGFAFGGWSVNYWDEHTGRIMDEAMSRPALKRETGPELQVHGSGDLIQTLMHHNLIDSKASTTGVAIGTYEPAGEIVTGSFALD